MIKAILLGLKNNRSRKDFCCSRNISKVDCSCLKGVFSSYPNVAKLPSEQKNALVVILIPAFQPCILSVLYVCYFVVELSVRW